MRRRQLNCELDLNRLTQGHNKLTFLFLLRGVDGIVVSNHAGRQVDGGISSLDALEKIVDAVGDKIYVRRIPFETLQVPHKAD